MTSFNDREQGFEAKFAHDEDTLFRINARRNRLLGEWAAALLGHSGEDAKTYAMSIVNADFEEAGDEDVFRKLSADLSGKADEATIRAKMHELLATARQQVTDPA